jgi:hypothetical protein
MNGEERSNRDSPSAPGSGNFPASRSIISAIQSWVKHLSGEWIRNPSIKRVLFDRRSELNKIRSEDFRGCTSLVSISIPRFVNIIRGLNVPASVELINVHAFMNCIGLKSVIFAANSHVREIHGFKRCRSLRRIDIPASVEVIGDGAFQDCTELTDVVFSGTVTFERSMVFATAPHCVMTEY